MNSASASAFINYAINSGKLKKKNFHPILKKYNSIDIEQIPNFTLIQGKEKQLPSNIHPKYVMYIEFNGYKHDFTVDEIKEWVESFNITMIDKWIEKLIDCNKMQKKHRNKKQEYRNKYSNNEYGIGYKHIRQKGDPYCGCSICHDIDTCKISTFKHLNKRNIMRRITNDIKYMHDESQTEKTNEYNANIIFPKKK
jgi:hypothetical protein